VTRRLLALGDSYTIGEGVGAAERWAVQLARSLRAQRIAIADPEIVAHTGWTTDELLAAIDRAAPRGPFDLVTLMIGVNDHYRGRAPETFQAALRPLIQRAVALAGGRDDGPQRALVLSIPDWGVTPFAAADPRGASAIRAQIDAYNAIVRQEAQAAGARHADITELSRRAAVDPSLLAADGLHPSGRMYATWLEVIVPAARAALAA
jgi:lysophospholipase L1-like esterase